MRTIFFECSNGEHSKNVKLSWKLKKSFAVLSNGATARLIKIKSNKVIGVPIIEAPCPVK